MKNTEIVKELRRHIAIRRIIVAALCVIFLVTFITFCILREQSKVVEEIGWGPIKHQLVTYNDNLSFGILVGVLGFVISIIFLLADFIFSRLEVFEIGEDSLAFYRGILHTNIYVNGELGSSIILGYHLEAVLSDGSIVNAALGKWSAHLTFTNGHPPIDV